MKYMTKVGELLGGGNSTREQMEKVMELEGKLAEVGCKVQYAVGFLQLFIRHTKGTSPSVTLMLMNENNSSHKKKNGRAVYTDM